ncbi:MAG: hypothetical protein CW341_00815 [Bacteroidetes bacterium]|nr:hypothetical protein [Bacteroidota bacterium]
MESRLPHRGSFKLYDKTLRYYLNNDDDLAQTCQSEAENMMNFVGLIGYTPVIRFENLENASGNINLNSSMKVFINLDESIRIDNNAIMATLAHEICHKLLYTSGLFYSDSFLSTENEVMADLATFYVGFGNLTMNGFCWNAFNKQYRSGYLSPKTYGLAYIISCTVNYLNPCEMKLFEHAMSAIREATPFLEKDFFYYVLDETSINDTFLQNGRSSSQAIQRLDKLMEMLQTQRESIIAYNQQLSDLFYNNPRLHVKAPQATPYMALAVKHLQQGNTDLRQAKAFDERLNRNIINFTPVISKILVEKGLKTSEFSGKNTCCPFCKSVSQTDLKEKKIYHFICPNCKKHFIVDNSLRDIPTRIVKTVKKEDDEKVETIPPTKTEYVYVGVNYGLATGIPLRERIRLFFKAQKDAWRSFITPSKDQPSN